MSGTPYFVKGCDTPYDGKDVYPRLEIHDLMKDPYQFSLFIQAMTNLQAEGYTPHPASWKEIAGIHGVPYARWSGDPKGPEAPPKDNTWDGYCYHSCVLFPTWHRVVMLFVEQAVSREAQAIITKYNYVSDDEQAKWRKAALTLRFPYWDWSDTRTEYEGLPKLFSYERLRVLGPDGALIRIRNPLHSYRYDSPPDDAPVSNYKGELRVYFDKWTRTYRWASGKNDPSEDYMELDTTLKQGAVINVQDFPDGEPDQVNFRPIWLCRDKLYNMFSFPATTDDDDHKPAYWDHFATAHPKAPVPIEIASAISSLEEPHNYIHNDLGGNGNMAYLEMAAYDPIFFFHHCNIDRLYALWEYVYPDYWMGNDGYINVEGKRVPFTDPWGTFQGNKGAAVKATTGLAPFRKPGGNYWTSEDTRGLGPQAFKKYYTYKPMTITYRDSAGKDVTVTIDVTKPSTLEDRQKYIAALAWSYAAVKTWATGTEPAVAQPPIFHHLPENAPAGSIPATHVPLEGVRDFTVVVTLPQFAFRGSHRLELYLDKVYVGNVSVFSRLEPEKCQNCVGRIGEGNPSVCGVIRLPHDIVLHLLEKTGTNKTETTDEEVLQVIKASLFARIVRPDKTQIAIAHEQLRTGRPPSEGTRRFLYTATEASRLVHDPVDISAIKTPPLDENRSPTMEIHSARILVSRDQMLPPMRDDYQSHGEVLEEEWCRWQDTGSDSD